MTKLRVEGFTLSLEGFSSGPDQSLGNPLGLRGTALHGWLFPPRTFQTKVFGKDGGETGTDDDFAARGFHNVGAWIMGRNMFGPVCGPCPDESWRGWWGESPVYHHPVFVLTNHPRAHLDHPAISLPASAASQQFGGGKFQQTDGRQDHPHSVMKGIAAEI